MSGDVFHSMPLREEIINFANICIINNRSVLTLKFVVGIISSQEKLVTKFQYIFKIKMNSYSAKRHQR